jgi:hypothetical protein
VNKLRTEWNKLLTADLETVFVLFQLSELAHGTQIYARLLGLLTSVANQLSFDAETISNSMNSLTIKKYELLTSF